MVTWCLPKNLSAKFKTAVSSGALAPDTIARLTSAERLDRIKSVIGDEDMSREVNAMFERNLLFVRRKFGYDLWIKKVSGELSDEQRKNIVDKVNSLDDRILNPYYEKNFLQDLAAEKLSTRVNAKQAKEIFDLAQNAKKIKADWEKTLDSEIGFKETSHALYKDRVDYGYAIQALQNKIDSFKPNSRTWADTLMDTLLIPKTAATGIFHLSALGVQGWGLWGRRATAEATARQFQFLWDQKHYDELQAYITSHPDYKYAKQLDRPLGLTDVSDQLSSREEAIQSTMLQRLNTWVAEQGGKALDLDKPLPINIIGASSRAFTGFLNYQRFTVFSTLLDKMKELHPDDVYVGSQMVQDLADVVNNFSGRGSLGIAEGLPRIQQALNAIFFAPRKVVATAQMFNPAEFGKLYYHAYQNKDYVALNAAAQNLVRSVVITGVILGGAKAFGYNVDMNPTSADFAKVEHDGVKYDLTGGGAIWIRLLFRQALGKETTARQKEIELGGSGFRPVTRAELLGRYVEGKLSPAAAIMTDFLKGTDPVGNEFDLPTDIRKHMEPIFAGTMMGYWHQNPEKSVYDIPVLASMFGIQAESPVPPLVRKGMNVWGEQEHFWADPQRTPFDEALDKTGFIPNFPGDTISGVKLTDKQYKQYIGLSGPLVKARLETLMSSQAFNNSNPKIQQIMIKSVQEGARRQIQNQLKKMYYGTKDNDIITKHIKNTQEKYGIEEADADTADTN